MVELTVFLYLVYGEPHLGDETSHGAEGAVQRFSKFDGRDRRQSSLLSLHPTVVCVSYV